jgi:type II secretory pathway pseudopilin PulG
MVISIIAILVAMLLPAIQAARESARNIQCTARMRQVFMLTTLYRQDSKDFYPAGHHYRYVSSGHPGFSLKFGQLMKPYIPTGYDFIGTTGSNFHRLTVNNNMLLCPASRYPAKAAGTYVAASDVEPFVFRDSSEGFTNNYQVTAQFGYGNWTDHITAAAKARYLAKRELPGQREGIAFMTEIKGNSPYVLQSSGGAGPVIYNHFGGKSTNVTLADGRVITFHESLQTARDRPVGDSKRLEVW